MIKDDDDVKRIRDLEEEFAEEMDADGVYEIGLRYPARDSLNNLMALEGYYDVLRYFLVF